MRTGKRRNTILIIIIAVVVIIAVGGKIALDKYCRFPEKPLSTTQADVNLIAHRGYSAIAPENTAPAFMAAGEAGFWGVECDVYRTADGKWVTFHDPVTYRMAGGVKILKLAKYENLASMTMKRGQHVEEYPGTGICTFEEYLDICSRYGVTAVIELKSKGQTEHYGEIVDMVQQAGVQARYISFQLENLQAIRALTDAPCGYLVRRITEEDIQNALALGNCGLDFKGAHEKNTDRVITHAKEMGLSLGAWTINSTAQLERLAALGVERITTDAISYE
ncbi:MAG: hypothetical protein IJP23_06335 [Oscillospiraceae bacterium]|nr:hypothetical protein [Oscillospiraceae bacterium]